MTDGVGADTDSCQKRLNLPVMRNEIKDLQSPFILKELKSVVMPAGFLHTSRRKGEKDILSLQPVSSECGLD